MSNNKVKSKVEIFPQKGGWVYVRVPLKITKELEFRSDRGLIPITAKVGKFSWKTSLLPMGDGTKFIALNAKVRKAENIELGKTIEVEFQIR